MPDEMFDYYKEPDLDIYVRRYTAVSPSTNELESIGFLKDVGMIATNDYEQWKNPYKAPMQPLVSGIGYVSPNNSKQTDRYIGKFNLTHGPVEISLSDILNVDAYPYQHGISGLGDLGAISWTPFVFTAFPGFTKMNTALSQISQMPSPFTRTLALMQKGLVIPQYVPYNGVLAWGTMPATLVSALSKLEINLTDVSKFADNFIAFLTPTRLAQLLTLYNTLITNVDYIRQNKPDSDSVVTNASRVVNIAKKVPDLVTNFKDWASYFVSSTMESLKYLQSFVGTVKKVFVDLPGLINTKITEVIAKIQGAVTDLISKLSTQVSTYTTAIKKYVSGFIDNLKSYVTSMMGAVEAWMKNLVTAIKDDMTDLMLWVKDRMSQLVQGMISDLTGVKDWIINNIMGLGKNIQDNVTNFGSQLTAEMKAKIEEFKGMLTTTKNEIVANFNNTVSTVKGDLQKYVTDIKAQFQGQIDNIKGMFTGLEDKIKNATGQVTALVDKTKQISELIDTLKKQYDARFANIEKQLSIPNIIPTTTTTTEKKGWFGLW